MSKRKLLILFFCASCLCIMSQSRRTTTHKSTTRTQTAVRKPQPQPTSGKLTERSFTFKAFETTGYFYTSYGNERFNVKSTFKFYYPIKCTDASVNTSMITQAVLKACFNADIEPTEQAMRQYAKTHAAWGDNFTPYTTTPKNIRITDTQFMGVRLASVYDDVLFFECSSEDFISGGQGLHGSYYIAVDAYTGQVLNASSFFSPDRQREIMSLLANTGVKYACSKYSSSDAAEIKSSLGYKARSSSLYFPTFYIKGNTLYLKFGVEELGWRSIGAPVFAIPLSMAKIDARKPKPAAPRQTTQSNAGQRTAPAKGTTSQPKSALERMANQPSGW